MLAQFSRSLGLCLIMLIISTRVDGQSIRGRVLDASLGVPVSGMIVKAVGPAGRIGAATLTDQVGAFTLTPPPTFQATVLAVERIGYANESFDLDRFATVEDIDLRVNFSPIELSGIAVTAESDCSVRPGTGSLYAIWDAARKSLEVTALTQSSRIVSYERETYRRDLRPSDYSVLRGSAVTGWVSAEAPYTSISTERATESGWVEGTLEAGLRLFAPDAAVLMTEEFASQHCFTAEVTGEGVVLNFTPNSQRRAYPELEGTMILDPETNELTELRFRYVGVADLQSDGGHAGGEIEFYGAPNGLRVVREWAIRAPVMSATFPWFGLKAFRRLHVDYVHEEGGRVLAVETGGGTLEFPVEPLVLGE